MDAHDWDERYSGDDLVWKADPNQFLVEEVRDLEPGKALDLACGEGRNAVWLATEGWSVTAVDFSGVGLAKGAQLATDQRVEVEWIEADVVKWNPPAAKFDLVIVFYLHLSPAERRRALGHAVDAMAPGGTFLLVGHDHTNLDHGVGGPPVPEILCDSDEIVSDLREANDDLIIDRAERVFRTVETDEGERQAIDTLVRARRAD